MNRQLPRGGCRLLPVLLVAILVGCQGTPPPSASLPATPAATQREQARERAQVTAALLDDDTAGVCRMDHPGADRKNHWETVYRRKPADSVSWYRPHLDVSLELLSQGGMNGRSAVIDVGDVLRVPLPPARFDLWHDRARERDRLVLLSLAREPHGGLRSTSRGASTASTDGVGPVVDSARWVSASEGSSVEVPA